MRRLSYNRVISLHNSLLCAPSIRITVFSSHVPMSAGIGEEGAPLLLFAVGGGDGHFNGVRGWIAYTRVRQPLARAGQAWPASKFFGPPAPSC